MFPVIKYGVEWYDFGDRFSFGDDDVGYAFNVIEGRLVGVAMSKFYGSQSLIAYGPRWA